MCTYKPLVFGAQLKGTESIMLCFQLCSTHYFFQLCSTHYSLLRPLLTKQYTTINIATIKFSGMKGSYHVQLPNQQCSPLAKDEWDTKEGTVRIHCMYCSR